ncbi:MAG: hypothetical protein AB1513_02915 [Pseudomonadota bacterium]
MVQRTTGEIFRALALVSVMGHTALAYAVDASPESAPAAREPIGSVLGSYLKDKLAIHVEHNYYDWYDDTNRSGRQNITPITLTYRYNDNFDFGVRRAYIESVNTSTGRAGRVAAWSDTSVSASYTFKHLAWPVRLSLDYNLPNGKATLSGGEKNAIMDGSLVQQTRFGEGENITPGIGVTHAFGEKDVFGAGLSFVKRGAFDPNGDVVNDEIDPGDETIATLQWQHSEERWLVIGGLIYTNSGATQRGGFDYYKKGDRYDANVTGLVALPYEQRLQGSLRYSTQHPDQYINNITGRLQQESANSNGDSTYLSLDWSKVWQGQHTFHVVADYLEIRANSYDQINDLYNAGRNKLSMGVGYDYAFNRNGSVSLQVKQFEMTDKATPATLRDTEYRGNNVSLNLRYAF